MDGQLVPIPINLTTINKLYGKNLTSDEVVSFLASKAELRKPLLTSEDVVLNVVGKELYEKFFRGYIRKQWDLDPSELDASVTARVPTRTNADDRYFTDSLQAMPKNGYTEMFQTMLSHENIHVMLNTNYKDIVDIIPHKKLIYTGPIDGYFDYQFGKLPYRSIHFQFELWIWKIIRKPEPSIIQLQIFIQELQNSSISRDKKHHKTAIVYEYPTAEADSYYPIPRNENQDIYNQYKKLADDTPDVYFTGRLGTYKYYNMDEVVAQSLALFRKIIKEEMQYDSSSHLSSQVCI